MTDPLVEAIADALAVEFAENEGITAREAAEVAARAAREHLAEKIYLGCVHRTGIGSCRCCTTAVSIVRGEQP